MPTGSQGSPQTPSSLVVASGWLRKEREFSFYGEIDVIPTEAYDRASAERAIDDATWVVEIATTIIPAPER